MHVISFRKRRRCTAQLCRQGHCARLGSPGATSLPSVSTLCILSCSCGLSQKKLCVSSNRTAELLFPPSEFAAYRATVSSETLIHTYSTNAERTSVCISLCHLTLHTQQTQEKTCKATRTRINLGWLAKLAGPCTSFRIGSKQLSQYKNMSLAGHLFHLGETQLGIKADKLSCINYPTSSLHAHLPLTHTPPALHTGRVSGLFSGGCHLPIAQTKASLSNISSRLLCCVSCPDCVLQRPMFLQCQFPVLLLTYSTAHALATYFVCSILMGKLVGICSVSQFDFQLLGTGTCMVYMTTPLSCS